MTEGAGLVKTIALRLLCGLCLFCLVLPSQAAQEAPPEEEDVFVLPEAEVSAERDTPELITREELDREGAADLWEAVRYLPGVVLSGGGRRNDSNFSIRGFGADSVPVMVDGIPLANPYRGEGDSARLLTGDLEGIEIKKGYSSQLLGANALGGMALMRTAKPAETLELSVKTTVDIDSVFHYASSYTALKLGTKQDLFYGLGVFQYRDADHFRLPGSFEPTSRNPQGSGDRLWSDSKDLKLTLLAGLTPIPGLDIWSAYIYQDADKGYSPPDTGVSYVIWHWPFWRRHSVSLNGAFSRGRLSLNGLFYFDKYDNRLDEYYNWKAYELGIHAPHSDYDEYSLGGRMTGGWELSGSHRFDAAFTWKAEDHRGLKGSIRDEDALREIMHVREATLSAGAEYTGKLKAAPLTFKAGLGFDTLIPVEYWNEDNEFQKLLDAGYYLVRTRLMRLYTWQAGVFYAITDNHELRLTYARKNHFPTMAQRYSTRFGSVLPNPTLGPEIANHFELGARSFFGGRLTINIAGYYSIVQGKMAVIQIPDPNYPIAQVDYTRNLDSTSFYGIEAAPEFFLNDYISGGLAFSWNRYSINHSQAEEKVVTYYPPVTLNASLQIHPWLKTISIIPRFEYTGLRYADSLGTLELPGYMLFHIKASADIGRHISLSAAVENIFDALYEIRREAPQGGRAFSFALEARY
jgi:iron complex outermembrane receptor protein